MQCIGIEFYVEIEPKLIDLGRLLLCCTEKRLISLHNTSPVTVHWRLANKEPDTRIRFTPCDGTLKHKGTCCIELNYYANRVHSPFFKNLNCLKELFMLLWFSGLCCRNQTCKFGILPVRKWYGSNFFGNNIHRSWDVSDCLWFAGWRTHRVRKHSCWVVSHQDNHAKKSWTLRL